LELVDGIEHLEAPWNRSRERRSARNLNAFDAAEVGTLEQAQIRALILARDHAHELGVSVRVQKAKQHVADVVATLLERLFGR